jgi:hypothetical protein
MVMTICKYVPNGNKHPKSEINKIALIQKSETVAVDISTNHTLINTNGSYSLLLYIKKANGLGLWCLTPLLTIFQLYRAD